MEAKEMNKTKSNAYVIGGGITGLSTAYFLAKSGKFNVRVLEQQGNIGGMANTFKKDGMYLDLGPHKFFSNMKGREKEVLNIIGKRNLLKIKKMSQIRLFDKFLDFPVGPIDVFKVNPIMGLRMGISFGLALMKSKFNGIAESSYEDYLKSRFGAVTYNLTFAPYANKIWADPKTLDKELASTRVAAPNLLEVVKQMIFKIKSKNIISADNFHYPIMGSGVFADMMAKAIRAKGGKIEQGRSLENVKIDGGLVKEMMINSEKVVINKGDVVVSTIPLEEISKKSVMLDKKIGKIASSLKYKNLILVYVVLDQDRISKQNWYFFPEGKYVFNRVFEQKGFSNYMVLPGKTVLCIEVTCDATDKIWTNKDDEKLINKVIGQLDECGLITKDKIIETFTKRMERAYPVYEVGFRNKLKKIFGELDHIDNLYSIGRQGGFNYVGMIDCFDIGEKTSSYILGKSHLGSRDALRRSFFNYVVID